MVILAAALLLVVPTLGSASDDARAIIAKAIKAHGGEKNLARMRCMRLTGEGIFPATQDGLPECKFRFEDTFNSPKQLKRVIQLLDEESPFKYVMVLNGDRGWIDSAGTLEELKGDRLKELIDQNHAHCADQLIHLLDKPYELTLLDEIELAGGPAVGVKVSAKGRRDVKLYFDKKTLLLVKREHMALALLDGTNREMLQEDFFCGHKDFDGLKHWTRITTHHDGKKTTDAKLTDLKFFEKLDDQEFEKP